MLDKTETDRQLSYVYVGGSRNLYQTVPSRGRWHILCISLRHQIPIQETFRYWFMKASTRRALNEPEIRTNPAAGTEDRLSRIWRRALNEPESDKNIYTLLVGSLPAGRAWRPRSMGRRRNWTFVTKTRDRERKETRSQQKENGGREKQVRKTFIIFLGCQILRPFIVITFNRTRNPEEVECYHSEGESILERKGKQYQELGLCFYWAKEPFT